MKPFFTAEDFIPDLDYHEISTLAAQVANAKLEREAKVVYGWFDGDGACRFSELQVIGSDRGEAEYIALLINIQPIEKPKCVKHEPMKYYTSVDRVFCRNCYIELVAQWTEKV